MIYKDSGAHEHARPLSDSRNIQLAHIRPTYANRIITYTARKWHAHIPNRSTNDKFATKSQQEDANFVANKTNHDFSNI